MLRRVFTNSSGILVSRIFGFVRDLLTASILGANIYSDMFFAAFKFPNLFRRIFGEGAFVQSFLPSFLKAKYKTLFTVSIFFIFSIIIISISILINIFSYEVTKIVAFGFSEDLIIQAAPIVAINFWYLILIFIVTYLGTLLNYKYNFWAASYSTALFNLALIGALLLSSNLTKIEIVYYLSYGVLVGGILQILLHIQPFRKHKLDRLFIFGISNISKVEKTTFDLKNFGNKFFPSVLGSSTAQLSSFIDVFLASFLTSGAISYLYYANRIFQLPLAIFAIATATAMFPSIAKAIKNKNEEIALKLLQKSFWFLFLLLSFSTFFGIYFSIEIFYFLFERGEFTSEDTKESALALEAYMWGLIPFGLSKIISLWLYSEGKQIEAAKISAKALIANIIFSFLLFPFGIFGLALSGSITGFILFILTIREFGFARFIKVIRFYKTTKENFI